MNSKFPSGINIIILFEVFDLHFILVSFHSMCDSGKWKCSENNCPTRCLIEGQFVTTFDGKQYALPGKCTYVASQVNIIPTTPLYNINQCCLFYHTHCFFLNYSLRVSTGR